MDSPKFHIHLVGSSAASLGGVAEVESNKDENVEQHDQAEQRRAPNALRKLASVFAHLTLRCGFPDVIVSASSIGDGRDAMTLEAMGRPSTSGSVGAAIANVVNGSDAIGKTVVSDADVLSTELGRMSGSAIGSSSADDTATLLEAAVQLLTGEMDHDQVTRILGEGTNASVLSDVAPYPFFRCRFDLVERALRSQRVTSMAVPTARSASAPTVPYFDFIIATDVDAFDFAIDYFNAAACAATTSLLASTTVSTCLGETAKPLGLFCIVGDDAPRLGSYSQRLVELLTHSKATSTSTAVAGAGAGAVVAAPEDAAKEEHVGGMGGYLDDDDEWGDEAEAERTAARDAASPSDDREDESAHQSGVAKANNRSELEQLLERGRWVDEVDGIVLQFQQLLGVDVLSYIV